ncbi:LacI family DNA-binding transcriptional regulator [Cellulomonas endophytica]|uniref:LacI family DNA-binding transcriptional regulator n=1 Tax=Cellulomonas endophytica TaxID=2494735 RepID=UPI0010101DCF|nr:LacI family DNA-binding transcriptional regulator [Cellulomonas endophytica]
MTASPTGAGTTLRVRAHLPTLEEVAELAGVSRSTASRAINGGLKVSPEAQAAVDGAVATLGYAPNRAARSLVTRRTDSVALVIPEPDERVLSDPFFAAALRGLTAALEPSDVQLVLVIAHAEGDRHRAARYLRNGHVDGVVVVSHHSSDELDASVARAGLPAVFIGRPWSTTVGLRYVDVDNVRGGRMAAEHLRASGRRRLATIAGPADMTAGVDRLRGWREGLAAGGVADDLVEIADFTPQGAAAATARLLDRAPDVDGLFVASDTMAAAALTVLAERGRRVPQDVAVVGYDDLSVATAVTPALTTLSNPAVAMARTAGELLLAQIARGVHDEEPVIFAPELVVRDSA